MCRPIESRDALGAMGPAASALFAGYQQPSSGKQPPMMMNLANPKTGLRAISGLPSAATGSYPLWAAPGAPFTGTDSATMMSMAAPPALPFVSFPKSLPAMPPMPWMNANNAPSSTDAMPFAFTDVDDSIAQQQQQQFCDKDDENDAFEAAELEELLDFTLPDDLNADARDKEDLVNLDDGFDGTEMSILYSFLVDAPEEKQAAKRVLELEADDGILNLNMLTQTPLESLMESLDDDDFTDEELLMAARADAAAGNYSDNHTFKHHADVKSRRLCRADDCYKRSRSNGMCISHGGGRRCAIDGCDKSSQGGNLCIRHGGGKRCSHDGCDKAAQSNFLCKAHGGGPRCQVDGCHRSSQGGGFCRSHGGGKRCMFDGCDKGTQRGDYCALHGGSRLCEVTGCMRNDRGGGLCATHGGGKRCTVDHCLKPCRRKGLCSAHLRQVEAGKQ